VDRPGNGSNREPTRTILPGDSRRIGSRDDGGRGAARQQVDHGAGKANGTPLALTANQHRGRITPEGLGQRVIEVAARETDVPQHAVVEGRKENEIVTVAPCRYDTPAETRRGRRETSESLGERKRKGGCDRGHGRISFIFHTLEAANRGRQPHARGPNTPSDGSDALLSQILIDKENECF
jgi:hypothetical protein